MKVLIIDSDTKRGEGLENKLNNLKHSFSDLESIQYYKNITESINVNEVKVLFIHSSNVDSLDFIRKFINDKKKWCVAYSGGGLGRNITNQEISSIDNANYYHIEESIGNFQEKDNDLNYLAFFKTIHKKQGNPFHKLVGFDPILEAKLEAIHILVRQSEVEIPSIVYDQYATQVDEYNFKKKEDPDEELKKLIETFFPPNKSI